MTLTRSSLHLCLNQVCNAMENLLTVAEAAKQLKIAPSTVRLHLKQGLLRGKKQGRQWRVFESALLGASAPRKTRQDAATKGFLFQRKTKVYAVSGALSDALAQIAAARAQLTTGTPMDAAHDLALLRGELS